MKVDNYNFLMLYKLYLNYKNIIKLITCRVILLSLGVYYTLYLSCVSRDNKKLALLIFSLIIIIDTFCVCVKRNGKDFEW